MTARVLVRAAVAPVVLLVVLASHVSLRSSSDLTPWKGGGFGMFSTIDSPGSRVLRVELETDLGAVPVAVPAELEELADAARTAPSTGRLVRLADELADQWWVLPKLPAPDTAASEHDEALRELAIETLSQVVPVDAVQAVEPARFDEAHHRRVEVRRVTAAVLRLEATGGEELRPTPIRAVSFEVASSSGDGER